MTQDVIKITYQVSADEQSYKEHREYDGSFGKMQLLRTIVGIYNDVVQEQHIDDLQNIVTDDDLLELDSIIKKLLGNTGDKTNAN